MKSILGKVNMIWKIKEGIMKVKRCSQKGDLWEQSIMMSKENGLEPKIAPNSSSAISRKSGAPSTALVNH